MLGGWRGDFADHPRPQTPSHRRHSDAHCHTKYARHAQHIAVHFCGFATGGCCAVTMWFRFYNKAHRDPKVARLSDRDFRLWVELLSVASENDGVIPCLDDLKHVLNRRLDHLLSAVDRLISVGLIERSGDAYGAVNWSKYQYKSDSSKERVTAHRKKKSVTVTPPETDTDTDTELVSKDTCPSGGSVRLEQVAEKWNELATSLGKPKLRKLTEARRTALKARIAGSTPEEMDEVFANIRRSAFLRGETGWDGCTFDWVFKAANFQKILEGNYNGGNGGQRRGHGAPLGGIEAALDRQIGFGDHASDFDGGADRGGGEFRSGAVARIASR